MAIQYNDITAIGDVFVVKSNTPIIGIQGVTGYTDDVLNETATRYFTREFRYSINGISYSEWIALTNTNLQNEFIDETDIFDIQYRYTRTGTDDTGFLTFNSISLTGLITEVVNPKIFTDLYFNKFFNYNDDGVLRWALNVLDKLYKRGIIAKYVERGEITNGDDDDYLAFFGAITHFFAILVRYAREFKDFTLNDVLLLEYLKQKNVFLCDDMSLSDLQNVLSNLYINFLERGTNEIVKKAGEDGRVYDGELLRLICKDDVDEFIFGLIEKEKTIWNVNNNSPLYKGTKDAINLVKAYEFEQDVQDLTKYPIIDSSNYVTKQSYDVDHTGTIRILNVNPTSGTEFAGIGDAENQSKLILIDPRMNYEISFSILQQVLGDYLYMNVRLFDEDENYLTTGTISAVDGSYTGVAIDNESLLKNGIFYKIKVLLFSQAIEDDPKYVLDIGFGNHLIISDANAKYMSIELGSQIVSGGAYDGNNHIRIWDFKVRPAIENYANGFVMIPNMLVTYIENNSEFLNQNVENKIRRFLLPYNTVLKNQFLDELSDLTGTPLQINIIKTDETILNSENGTITINAIGGIEPYVYSIDNGVTFNDTNYFTDLAPGTYNVVVEDSAGTQVTGSVTIDQGVSDLAIELFGTPASKLGVSDGEIEVLVSGGISPYYYSLNDVDYQVSNKFTGLSIGNYTVYVKDSVDNTVNKSIEITAVRDNLLTVTVRDEKSVVVEGVSVNITNLSGFNETEITDINGQIEILLETGGYNLTFTKSGYKKLVINNLSVVEDRSYNTTIQTYYTLEIQHEMDPGILADRIVFTSIFTPNGQSPLNYEINFALGEPIPLLTINYLIAGNYKFRSTRYFRDSGGVPTSTSYTLTGDDLINIILEQI